MEVKKKKTTINELGEMLTYIVGNMATKEDIADVRRDMATKADLAEVKADLVGVKADLAGVKAITLNTASELAIVRRDVEEIKEKVRSHDGFAKEIDHTISRVVVIEKHLGLAK
ncbi:hypothetical protein HZC00_04580 [Candidatus Kaiserbacteria bacterium]|nr:hypothetical protein [Candidatus Kaiserbacteria bacterium]